MQIAVIGTGFIATTLGRSLAGAGHRVIYGSRHPESEETPGGGAHVCVNPATRLSGAEAVILRPPRSGGVRPGCAPR